MGGGYPVFPSKIFCLSVPKKFVGGPLNFKNVLVSKLINKVEKNAGKSWDSKPDLPLQKPVVLPTVPWEQLLNPTNVSEIVKISDTAEIRTRAYRFITLLS